MKDHAIDPDGDFSEIRALPHFRDAVYLSCASPMLPVVSLWAQRTERFEAWGRAVNALMRTVPL